jgi:hypothetical protein
MKPKINIEVTHLLTEAHRQAEPLAGRVCAITGLGAVGVPEPEFGGDGAAPHF